MALEYTTEDMVRDYECDSQGIVNNAEFMHYCEHARNRYIARLGHNLDRLHEMQEDPVVAKAEMDFVHSLRGGDVYQVHTRIEPKGSMRLLFYQTISKIGRSRHTLDKANNTSTTKTNSVSIMQRQESEIITVCLRACFTIAVVKNGRPIPIAKSVFANLYS